MVRAVPGMFSSEDVQRIRETVRVAEQRTNGEIVPMMVAASGRYREAGHLAGLALALLVMAGWAAGAVQSEWAVFPLVHPGWIVLAVLTAYALGVWIGNHPSAIRRLVSDDRMALKVRLRAERAFYEHGLHRTRGATGVLILLSLLEHRIQILADRAINERVPPGTWDHVVTDLIRGIKERRPTDSLCGAITACGDLLAAHFPPTGSNPNELSNEVIHGPDT